MPQGTAIACCDADHTATKGITRVTDTWSKADLHIHSNHSDGLASIPEIMEYVQHRTDLSVIAITDHNTIEGALFAQSLAELYDFEVVVGTEVSSSEGHILGLFLEEDVRAGHVACRHHPGDRGAGRHRRHRASVLQQGRLRASRQERVCRGGAGRRLSRARGLQLAAVPGVGQRRGRQARWWPRNCHHGGQRRSRARSRRQGLHGIQGHDRRGPACEHRQLGDACRGGARRAVARLRYAWRYPADSANAGSGNWERCKAH